MKPKKLEIATKKALKVERTLERLLRRLDRKEQVAGQKRVSRALDIIGEVIENLEDTECPDVKEKPDPPPSPLPENVELVSLGDNNILDWPVSGRIMGVSWTDEDLFVGWEALDSWDRYEIQPPNTRAGDGLLGNLIFGFFHAGKIYIGSSEWFGTSRGTGINGPPDNAFEGRGLPHIPNSFNDDNPNVNPVSDKILIPGEPMLIAAAAPCRYGATPRSYGLDPIRTPFYVISYQVNQDINARDIYPVGERI